jgi:broad specificity phosphatase PhoE
VTRLYFVRHGDTYFEADRRMKGQLDVPLCPRGREQAAEATDFFRGARVDAVYCSTLRRTEQGARLVGEAVGAPVIATPLLDERGWGVWQGLTAGEIARERAAGRAGSDGFGSPGEPAEDFAQRVALFMELIAHGRRGQTVVAVTHGGALKNAVLPALGLTTRDRSAFTADTGTLSLLEHDGVAWRPVFLNCTPARAAAAHRPDRVDGGGRANLWTSNS